MNEIILFIIGGIFLFAAATTMAILGKGRGGRFWAAAWACLYTSGLLGYASTEWPALMQVVVLYGTLFPLLLYAGTSYFTGQPGRFPMWLVPATAVVGLTRMATVDSIGRGYSEFAFFGLATVSVAASCWLLLKPAGRESTLWERALGYGFPTISLAAGLFAWVLMTGTPWANASFPWLLVAVTICTLQIGGLISLNVERMQRLKNEARASRAAQIRFAAHHRDLTDQTSDLVAELDSKARILYANPAHAATLGFDPPQLLGQVADYLSPIIPRLAWPTDPDTPAQSTETTVVVDHQDGRPVTLECSLRRFIDPQGEQRIVVTSRDVSARIAAEQAREEGRVQLEALVAERSAQLERSQHLAALGTMAAGIAHQINNPIGSIQMGAEFALSTKPEEPEREKIWRDALENGIAQAKRCGEIVSSMLQLARNEPTPKSRIDLTRVVHRVREQTERYAAEMNADLAGTEIGDGLYIHGSEIEIEQALVNILRNACESGSQSGQRVRVQLEAGRNGARTDADADRIRIRISDNGQGMTDAERSRVFHPFFTTKLGRGGTGLGLSVAREIVVDHGGEVTITTQVGVGTTFDLLFPADEISADERAIA